MHKPLPRGPASQLSCLPSSPQRGTRCGSSAFHSRISRQDESLSLSAFPNGSLHELRASLPSRPASRRWRDGQAGARLCDATDENHKQNGDNSVRQQILDRAAAPSVEVRNNRVILSLAPRPVRVSLGY